MKIDLSSPSAHSSQTPRLTLEAIFTDKIFDAHSLRELHWMRDSRRFSYLDRLPKSEILAVWIYEIETGQRTPVVPMEQILSGSGGEPLSVSGYLWSPDESRLVLARPTRAHGTEFETTLRLFTISTQKIEIVANNTGGYRNVKWSPDGKHLGYVCGDDLYVRDLLSGVETRLTDTATSTRYNGRFGWVYEEELDLVDGWCWSPDGHNIAYYQIDEAEVPTVELTRYDEKRLTPRIQRYPKAGDPNPAVRIGVIDLRQVGPASGSAAVPLTRWVDLGADGDIYIAQMQWTPQGELWLQRIPRLQNRLELLRVNLDTFETNAILTENDTAWVDAPCTLKFMGDDFVWPSDRNGFEHLYRYRADGTEVCSLTSGQWEVDRLLAIDQEQQRLYFSACYPEPRERQVYSVSWDGSRPERVTQGEGTHHLVFSPDCHYFLDTYSRRTLVPTTTLYSNPKAMRHLDAPVASIIVGVDGRLAVAATTPIATITSGLGSRDVTAEDAGAVANPSGDAYIRAHWEYTRFTTSDGVELEAAVMKPADFQPSRRYPVLMYTYGGPGSQVVIDTYGSRVGLEQYLSQQGFVLAMVDGRGAGGRGREFKKTTYLNLGHYEVEDQIAGAKWLATLPYVDADRIGIWGWSYGGYMTSLCILRGADVFRAAVAVAPVTHWNYYDTIYTERYMRRPQDNPEGYDRSSPIKYADKLKGKYLLMHGLADDNVHFQNAADLAAVYQKQGTPFEMMVYPGKHHGLEGVGLHWATMLCDFLCRTLL